VDGAPRRQQRRHRHRAATIVTGRPSRVTIVDVDDEGQVAQSIREFGDTPLKTRTSRGMHLWFQHAGERNANLRPKGLAAEIKSTGSLAVVPPSVHLSGARYALAEGSWSDLARLPRLRPSALLSPAPAVNGNGQAFAGVNRGTRNNTLFNALRRDAPHCDDLVTLLDVARTINGEFDEPLLDAEVCKTASSVWKMQCDGRNWLGRRAVVQVESSLIDRLLAAGHADAFALWARLRQRHWNRPSFAISPKAMAQAKVIGDWSPRRYAAARDVLEQHNVISVLNRGGRWPGDASKWRFGQGC
jgi:hypothetical protein